MYHILEEICHNYIAQAAFWGWFSAQAIKFLWQLVRYRTLRFERLVGSGGFPSSHTSFVISTTASLYFKNHGITDIFVVALVFSIKRNIPVILKDREIALKELLGHTPVEVFGGLVLGILIAYIQYFYVYNGVI